MRDRRCAAATACLLVITLGLLGWARPALAKQCDNEQVKQQRKLDRALRKCGDSAECQTAARDACFADLSRFECDVSLCGSGGLGASPGDLCAFNTEESASKALNQLLASQVLPKLNQEWPTKATTPPPDPTGLDPYQLGRQEIDVGCSAGDDAGYVACAGFCDKVTANVTPTVHGLQQLQFQSLVVNTLTTQDLSSFSSGGPDASRVHAYGPPPADGTAWNDSRYTVVFPWTGTPSAIVTDLGQVFTLCGGGSCQPLLFQGSGDDTYQIDYSPDGHQWTSWVTVPPSGDNNLRTRSINVQTTPQARFVRTYAVSSSNTSTPQYSVSRLVFSALNSYGVPGPRIISTSRPARGPQPKVTTSPAPPAGSSAWNDPLATVLPNEGPASAITIDVGKVVYTRTDFSNNPGVILITSGNDEYRLEYSTDGISWTLWKEVPQRCGCSELESNNVPAPNVAGRYFRIYHPAGTPGDGKYSVAQFLFLYALTATGTQTFNTTGARTFGPEALATNGEFAPAGTTWNDSRYASVIPGVGKDFGLIVDLGEATGRGITRVKIQADANDTYVVLISSDALEWEILYIANPVSGNGLQTRDSGDTLRDFNGNPWVGRYIWVYASTGDGSYSVSEIEVFNDILAAGCPFDATANSIALGSAQCSYSGDVLATAAMPAGTPLTVDLDDITVTARCNPPLLPSYDIQLYPLFSGSTSGTCNFTPIGLEADVNFCAVTCDSSSTEPVELTYMQVNGQPDIAPPPDKSQCSTGEAFSSSQLEADVTAAIGLTVTDLVTAAVQDVQNALLRQNSPFPGEKLASGAPAVCTP